MYNVSKLFEMIILFNFTIFLILFFNNFKLNHNLEIKINPFSLHKFETEQDDKNNRYINKIVNEENETNIWNNKKILAKIKSKTNLQFASSINKTSNITKPFLINSNVVDTFKKLKLQHIKRTNDEANNNAKRINDKINIESMEEIKTKIVKDWYKLDYFVEFIEGKY